MCLFKRVLTGKTISHKTLPLNIRESYTPLPVSFGMEVVRPSFRLDDVAELTEGIHHPGIREPRPPKVCNLACARNGAMQENKSGLLSIIRPRMCCYHRHFISRNNMYLCVLHSKNTTSYISLPISM